MSWTGCFEVWKGGGSRLTHDLHVHTYLHKTSESFKKSAHLGVVAMA